MTMEGMTQEQVRKLELAEKLFRTAGRSPAEAAEFTAKAMAILEELNLDMSVLEQGGADKARRADEKMAGGLYKWQRELWESIASLHFCWYWNQYTYDPDKVSKYRQRKARVWGMSKDEVRRGGYRFEHRLVGRVVNIVAVKNMAQYLEQTIERLTREHVVSPANYFTNYATSFRQGIAEEVIGKVYARRNEKMNEERAARERAAAASMADASTSRAMTLSDVQDSEYAANYDFLHGDGEWAALQALRAKRAREAEEAERAYAQWAAEHPDEARAQEQERLKARRRRTSWNAGMRSERDNRDWSAYSAGREVGKSVGIDPQASGGQSRRAIR